MTNKRQPTPGTTIDSQFTNRWSPRAMSGEVLDEPMIRSLIEAARWAPSCFNAQPWRFAVATPDSPGWAAMLGSLIDANQLWASRAGALVTVASRTHFEQNEQAAPTHSFDAGAAWISIALQASRMQLVAHAMYGFDQAAARAATKLPDAYALECVIALGHPGDIADLPEKYAEREQPSDRKPLADILFADDFSALTELSAK